ncbi:hypothetical protein Q8W71_15135 [Methylobacterium sp. NEAU 140]|uniref:helix-turn-helix domain-containing protein n=1 Tax=Methylobacterium sp. NEAU 140 TaxID=3064945 RepID=UPI002735661D|nr:hypothetical protein [Methylobacterium sp. NEAU 140]MDP4023963.1 hypothetical protein [Methylobacterium sp. NEAU 140]
MPDEPIIKSSDIAAALKRIRKRLGYSKKEMAGKLGLRRGKYACLEASTKACTILHLMAVQRLTLQEAKVREDNQFLSKTIREEVKAVATRPL